LAITFLNLVPGKYIESSTTTQYTANAVKTVIDKFTVNNISSSNVTIDVNIVREGGSASDSNSVIKQHTIPSGVTYLTPEMVGQTLNTGDFITASASIASSVSLRVSGREIN